MSYSKLYSKFLNTNGVCTDTRNIVEGSIFFALKGPSFNANEFAIEALEKGARYAVIDEPQFQNDRTILVDDSLTSLQSLANEHRKHLKIPIIGITGSNGKTTTKELLDSVLSKKYDTLATVGNLNNHIGVPLTLLSIKEDHEIAIIEMGANHKEEIADLCKIAEPDFGVITNIGRAHIGEFGGIDNIQYAKTRLFESVLKNSGVIFVNADDQRLADYMGHQKSLSIGQNGTFARGVATDSNPLVIELDIDGIKQKKVQSNLIGDYNLTNALSAAAIGHYFGVSASDIIDGLQEYTPKNSRSQMIKTNRYQIISDAYNANPDSVLAAIENLAEFKEGKTAVVLGDMFELGDYSYEAHQQVIDRCHSLGISEVLTAGNAYLAANDKSGKAFSSTDELLIYLKKNPPESNTILVKGSRGMKLEKAIALLQSL